MDDQEKKVDLYAYALTMEKKRDRSHSLLPREEIMEMFRKFKEFPYKRYSKDGISIQESKYAWIGDSQVSLFVEDITENKIKFFIGRERDDELPQKVSENEQEHRADFEDTELEDGQNLIEKAYGTIYFLEDFPNHCLILFQHNYHSYTLSKILDFVKNKTDSKLFAKIITTGETVEEKLRSLSEVRAVILRNQTILPEAQINVGDELERIEDQRIFVAKNLKFEIRENRGAVRNIFNRFVNAFRPGAIEAGLEEFLAQSGMKLLAIEMGESDTKLINFLEDMKIYSYSTTRDLFLDSEVFFRECDNIYENNKEELVSLIRAIIDADNRR
ncbi:MAG: hypothetical protein ACTSWK_16830 [Promethearchaeota archaeon]